MKKTVKEEIRCFSTSIFDIAYL